jgi:hypothetical protein
MPSYDVGYKKPPREWQFKPGNRCNPHGRGKRKVATEAEILERVLNFPVKFRHRGKTKRAPRIEVMIRSLGSAALKGDVGAAEMLLRIRAHCQRHGDINPTIIMISEKDAVVL